MTAPNLNVEKGANERDSFIVMDAPQPPWAKTFTKLLKGFILIAFAISIIVTAVGLGIHIGKQDVYNDTTPLISTNLTPTIAGYLITPPDETDPSQQIKRQISKLRNLGCKPNRQAWKIKENLDPNDDLMDKYIFPEEVVVERCIQTTSYCTRNRDCLPKEEERMPFTVSYVEDGEEHFEVRYAIQHTSCICQ